MKPTLFNSLSRGMILAMSGWLLAACSDGGKSATGPVAPPSQSMVAGASQTANNLTLAEITKAAQDFLATVKTLGRVVPLATDLTASATIGQSGGTISIPAAGVTLIVPKGAVSSNVTFKITALAGSAIAYEFEPHGMTFKKPLRLRQNLGLSAWLIGRQLKGGYFSAREDVNTKSGQANIREELPAWNDNGDVCFDIWHFSGYLVSMA